MGRGEERRGRAEIGRELVAVLMRKSMEGGSWKQREGGNWLLCL